jgi:type IV pilus secretin PilQ/predicted competence protein
MIQLTPPGKPFRRKTLIICFCFLLCATLMFSAINIKQVKYFNDEEKTRVIFESDQPVVYSAYTTPDRPEIVVLDFPDIQLGDVQKVLNVLSPELNNIQFNTINLSGDAFITRAELQLTAKLPYNISQQSNFLYIDVLKKSFSDSQKPSEMTSVALDPPKTSENIPESAAVASEKTDNTLFKTKDSQTSLNASKSEAANNYKKLNLPCQLREITYDMTERNLAVNLSYDGNPEYSSFELQKPDRLIIDLHATTNRVYPKQVNLNTDKVLKIRTAQFQSEPVAITRVVFDIKQPLTYRIFKTEAGIKVGFGTESYLSELDAQLKPVNDTSNSLVAEIAEVKSSPSAASSGDGLGNVETVDINADGEKLEAVSAINKTAEVKNEDPGKPQPQLFETADPAGSNAALLGQEVPVEKTGGRPDTKQLVTDEDYAGKVVAEGKRYVGETIGMNFKDVDIRDVILIIGNITGKNFIIDPRVKGKVTINFTSVPWDQALDIILSMNNLGMVEENNVIIVASMDQLEAKAKKESSLEEERTLAGPVDVYTRRISYAKADEVAEIVKAYISRRGQVLVDKRTNLLLIRELRSRIGSITDLIDQLDIATRQVHIEARIIETTRTYEKDLGIQWGFQAIADDAHGNATRYIFPHDITAQGATNNVGIGGVPYAVNLPASAPTSGIALSMGNVLGSFNLDLSLQAMEESGKGKILSSPSISTQNNIEANIMSGSKIPYTSIVDNTASVTFIQAKLEMKVTPQITSDNTIIMKVEVEKTEPDYSRLITNVQGALPTILEKKAQTTMLVKDGGTAVIGGILQINDSEADRRVPFFYKIPLLGWLFQAKNWKRSDSELLIFITPQILGYN